jgi:hypothetical protein
MQKRFRDKLACYFEKLALKHLAPIPESVSTKEHHARVDAYHEIQGKHQQKNQ